MNPQKTSCVNCIYWQRAEPYICGICIVPIPYWVKDKTPVIFPDKNTVVECKAYWEKTIKEND